MVTFEQLQCFVNDSILNEWFIHRENELASVTMEDKANIKDLLRERKKNYHNILVAINNVPNGFTETRKMLKESMDTYVETLNCVNGYNNEKYYKCGFCDGIKLFLECSEQKKEKQ